MVFQKRSFQLIFLLILSITFSQFITRAEEDGHHEDDHHDAAGGDHHDDSAEDDHLEDDKDDKDDDGDHHDDDHHNDDEDHDPEIDHDAVAGSKHDADEFKELSPEESKARLKILVAKMDTNHDQIVDGSELKQWIINSLKNLDTESSKEKVKEQDVDKDGKVTFDEYTERLYGYKPEEIENMKKNLNDTENKEFVQILEDDKEKFALADRNNDGALDEIEYSAFAHPANYPHMAPYELKKTLGDLDANKDGVINEQEFIGNRTLTQPQKLKEHDEFVSHDKNKDGVLNKEEILIWTMPGFAQQADAEVKYLFKKTDLNNDTRLTPDEIVEQNTLWVGSHATDYGRHLEDMYKKKEEL